MSQDLLTEKYLAAAQQANEDCASVEYSENALGHGAADTPGWTTGLTIICIFFFLISFFGCVSAGFGLNGLFGPQEVTAANADAHKPRELKEFERNYAQAQERFFPVLVYLEIMKLALALCFLFAIVLMFIRSKKARHFAIGLCAMAVLFHLCNMGMNFWLLSESGGSFAQLFDSALDDARHQGGLSQKEHEEAKEFVINSVGMGMTIGLAVVILVRLLFYGCVIAYLCQGEIKPIFGEDGLEYMKKGKTEDAFVTA